MVTKKLPEWATTVTPLSKVLAMVLFILLPFIGFYLGFQAGLHHSSTPLPATKLIAFPTATSSPTSVISEMPDELKVSRAISQNPFQEHNYPLSSFKTINNQAIVQKLYRAILALPPYPTGVAGEGHCVAHPFLVRYDLSFFKNGKLVQHGTINLLVGCGAAETVSLDGTYRREFYSLDKDTYR